MSAKNKILVLDDDRDFLSLLGDYFKSHHYEVILVDNLEDAVTRFRQHRPRVVLLDFNLPLVTGEKFLPVLQSMDPMVRVIVVTGELAADVKDRFSGMGYFGFFEKGGLSLEALKQKVEEAFHY